MPDVDRDRRQDLRPAEIQMIPKLVPAWASAKLTVLMTDSRSERQQMIMEYLLLNPLDSVVELQTTASATADQCTGDA